jgi:hypothetical protein
VRALVVVVVHVDPALPLARKRRPAADERQHADEERARFVVVSYPQHRPAT